LKIVTSDVNSDVGGNATIPFESPLRASPNDNDVLTISKATTTFMLANDEVMWQTQAPVFNTFTIQGIEAI